MGRTDDHNLLRVFQVLDDRVIIMGLLSSAARPDGATLGV
jgi:hypothetical protein